MKSSAIVPTHALEQTAHANRQALAVAMPHDRVIDAVIRSGDLSRGTFPLWPINRFFSSFAGTGGQVEQLLLDAGIDPGGNADVDEEIAAADLVRLLRRAMRLTSDELWGLCSTPTKPGTFAQACRLAVHANTVGDALRRAFGFYHGVIDDFTLRLTVNGDLANFLLIDTQPHRPGRDILHIVILQVLRETTEWLSGRVGWVRQIDFLYPPLPDARPVEALFRAAMAAHASRTGLLIDRHVLACPVVVDERQIPQFVASLPSKLAMIVQDRRTVAERAASYMRAHAAWDAGRDDVAAALNMSAATFRRRLHEDIGVSFQELKDRLRCAAAHELMAIQGLQLEQVARTLGFSELSSFHRAFKRWTGQAPGLYRYSE